MFLNLQSVRRKNSHSSKFLIGFGLPFKIIFFPLDGSNTKVLRDFVFYFNIFTNSKDLLFTKVPDLHVPTTKNAAK